MAWFDWGNAPINSTATGIATNPDTTTLVAEIDSTQLGTANYATGQSGLFRTTWIVGCSTTAIMVLEQTASTALAATVDSTPVSIPTGQSGQYVLTMKLEKNHRLRVRMNSSVTATATAKIHAEPLT